MFLFRLILTLNCIITFTASGANGYGPLSGYARAGAQQSAMDTYGLDSKLASILGKYYKNNFTSEQEWETLKSIRLEGVLFLNEDEFRFNASKKKPYYSKLTVLTLNGGSIEMGYDGEDAWQCNTRGTESAFFPMTEAEVSNFTRDATIGGHLLYPLINGKKIELLGAADVEGSRCYEIQITLPDSQVIRSFLDITDYSQRRIITINQVSSEEEITTNSDFRKIAGIRVPFISVLTIDGKQVHKHHITDVKVNYGVMDWMFGRPISGSPGKVVISANKTPKNTATPGGSTVKKSPNSTFGTYFGTDSVFDINPLDYKSDQINAILRDAGVAIPAKN
jgi:hypothetical protein